MLIVAILVVVAIVLVQQKRVVEDLFLSQSEVLTNAESGIPESVISNSKPMNVWWDLGAKKFYVNKPDSPQGTCLSTRCCAPATDMDYCDALDIMECDKVIYN